MSKRILIVVVVTSAIVVAIGGTALAKGPESATITGPGIDEPIELVNANYRDSDYTNHVEKLMRQTGIWFATSTRFEPAGDLGPPYTLTWIFPGPSSEPVRQLLYLYAENGPVIHTPAQEGLEGWEPSGIGWFAAPDGLADTLAALGVPVSAQKSNSGLSISNKTTTSSAEAEPTVRLRYLAVVGFGLTIGLVWATRRRKEDA